MWVFCDSAPELSNASFLKVSCNAEPETNQSTYSSLFCWKSAGLSWTLKGSLTHAWFWFTELGESSKWWHNIRKITFVDITTDVIRKVFGIGNLSSSWWQIQVFQKFNLHLKAYILLLATNTNSCFPWIDRLTSFIFEKMVVK